MNILNRQKRSLYILLILITLFALLIFRDKRFFGFVIGLILMNLLYVSLIMFLYSLLKEEYIKLFVFFILHLINLTIIILCAILLYKFSNKLFNGFLYGLIVFPFELIVSLFILLKKGWK